jgi:hypothetical protein
MKRLSRRDFTRTTVAAGAGAALSRMRILGANDRVNVGLIGCGDRGLRRLSALFEQGRGGLPGQGHDA